MDRAKRTCSVLIAVGLVFAVLSSPVLAEPYQCDVDGDNRLGLQEAIHGLQLIAGLHAAGAQTVLDCGDPPNFSGVISNPGTLSNAAKRYLLCKANEIRSQTALGVATAPSGNQPVATNMQRMQWDENLATVASNHADECVWAHSDSTSRGNEYSLLAGLSPGIWIGENIYASTVDPSVFAGSYGIAGSTDSWSAETAYWTYGTSNGTASCSPGEQCGHYTQQVWAETTKVGCGYYNCASGLTGALSFKTFVVCNYYPGGNYIGDYPYSAGSSTGDVCTVGTQPGDTCENGLIIPADYTTGIPYDCDVNADGKQGLEEIVHALQVVSGLTTLTL